MGLLDSFIKRLGVLAFNSFLQIRLRATNETTYFVKFIQAVELEGYISIIRDVMVKGSMLHLTLVPCPPIPGLLIGRKEFLVEVSLKLCP